MLIGEARNPLLPSVYELVVGGVVLVVVVVFLALVVALLIKLLRRL